MKKAIIRTLCASAMLAAAFSITAFADTITSVKFEASMDDGDPTCLAPGQDPNFEIVDNDMYSLDWECISAETLNVLKTPKTYKLTFSAEGENTFAKADQITVTGTGVQSITSKSVKDSGQTLEVKVKAWPYVKMDVPEASEEENNKITIKKNGAGTIEYILVYTDFDDEEHTVHSTTTSTTINTTAYNKEYKGSDEEKKGKKKEVIEFACRAIKPSSASNPYIVPSDWSNTLSASDYDTENYETWGDYFGSSGSGSKKTNTSSASKPSSSGPSSTASNGGWSGSGNDWYYKKNGTNVTGWVADGGNWYYCDPAANGKMKAGWVKHTDGYWYYLNEAHDGTYGRMLTSWQTINGKTYYFRPNDGGPKGSMVIGTVKINGTQYTFNNDGQLVQ